MPRTHSAKRASVYRRKAQTLGKLAECAQSISDHKQLLRMRVTCVALAAGEDRLGDLPPLPPARALALPIRH
jgi:hypothetical protein